MVFQVFVQMSVLGYIDSKNAADHLQEFMDKASKPGGFKDAAPHVVHPRIPEYAGEDNI